MKRLFLSVAFALLPLAATHAQTYPEKPVRLIVGFNPGGPTDQVARVVAEHLSAKFKQPFVVENRSGGNGAIAAQAVISSPPDGYTLLVGTSGALTVSPNLLKSMPYSPSRDLTPIAALAGYPYALVVPTSLPVNDVASLVEYVKKNPGKISFSSSGNGSVNHLAGEWFRDLAKIDIAHVPYKGDAPAITDLIAGNVQMGFNTLTTSMAHVESGKLRALAVTSEKPTHLAPSLKPMTEQGYPNFVVEPWNGILGPANMPKALVEQINAAVNEVLAKKEVQERIEQTKQYVIRDTPAQMRQRMENQTAQWAAVVRAANIKVE